MAIGTWWLGDPVPDLPPLPALSVQQSTEQKLIAHLAHLSYDEVEQRFQAGNRLYLAYIDETPVAYGWLSTRIARISELQLASPLPTGNCYLWDFLTVPEWRGQGIYAQFLQGIIRQEIPEIAHFWIGYAPGNEASKRGISKAGFQFVADFVVTDNRASGIMPFEENKKALACATVFNLPLRNTTDLQ